MTSSPKSLIVYNMDSARSLLGSLRAIPSLMRLGVDVDASGVERAFRVVALRQHGPRVLLFDGSGPQASGCRSHFFIDATSDMARTHFEMLAPMCGLSLIEIPAFHTNTQHNEPEAHNVDEV